MARTVGMTGPRWVCLDGMLVRRLSRTLLSNRTEYPYSDPGMIARGGASHAAI
jgi:hypothetical protein